MHLGPRGGGGEGRMNCPWSGLLTRRMLAQGKDWSNASEIRIKGPKSIGIRESRSDDREKIPGLVPTLFERFSKL